MSTTLAQQQAVAIAPKFTAFASFIASSILALLILKRRGRKTTRPYHRLVLGMACTDLTASAAWFFTTWPIPKGTAGVYGAIGNQQTCSAQAFFAQFSLSTVMYNASLALYYALVIVKGMTDDEVRRIEPWMHLNAVSWGLGTSLASLGLTLFNQVGWDCWISAAPLGCKESWQLEPGEVTTCTRGDNGSLYQWAFYYAPLWAVIVLVSCLMYTIYFSVRKKEKAMERYVGNSAALRAELTQVAYHVRIRKQAFYYIGAFFISWFFPTVFQIVIVSRGEFPFWLLFLTAFFIPCQGILNLAVFVRPKYNDYRKKNQSKGAFCAWFAMLREEFTCSEGKAIPSKGGPEDEKDAEMPSKSRRPTFETQPECG